MSRRNALTSYALAAALLLNVGGAHAQGPQKSRDTPVAAPDASPDSAGWTFGGHVKLQFGYINYRRDDLHAAIGDDPARDQELDARLKAERRSGPWDFAAHYEVLGLHGDSLATHRRLAALGLTGSGASATGLPDDRRRLFKLTDELSDQERRAAVQRFDRLAVGHSSERQVLRFGRQAVSWGNGLVFQTLDVVNPFSPLAIDKDYKTGDDMLYGQWVVGEQNNEVQAILLPRRAPATRDLEAAESSAAAKYHGRYAFGDIDVLLARHFDENLLGAGVVKSLGGAVWRLDAAYTDLKDSGGAASLVTNIDYSWMFAGKNMYGYAEYFRSGVGATDRSGYANPEPSLSARIARGELFTLARDYAALGLQIEASPLVNIFQNLVWNLNDASSVYQVRGVYDWRQDVQLMAGANLPRGERGSEFGGISTALPGVFAGAGRSVYIRAAYYF